MNEMIVKKRSIKHCREKQLAEPSMGRVKDNFEALSLDDLGELDHL